MTKNQSNQNNHSSQPLEGFERFGGLFDLILNAKCEECEECKECEPCEPCEPCKPCKPCRNEMTEQELKEFDLRASKASDYLQELGINETAIDNLLKEFYRKFPDGELSASILKLRDIKPFAAGGNIFEDSDGIDNETLFVMRWLAGIKMEEVLSILKFDLTDSNLMQDLTVGNIGTAQRWAKTITGADLEDSTEIMCGRYTKKPRLATFPNNNKGKNIPITKRVDLASVCSHHFLPYGSLLREDSYAIISYVPEDYVLGISKLQRLADWVARRPTIQEDLVQTLFNAVKEASKSENVYVGLFNARHTCEYLRGSQSHDGAFTTEYYGGLFENKELRDQVLKSV